MNVTIVLGTSTGGVGTHVRSLVERLPDLGMTVKVAGPAETGEYFGFAASGATFEPVPIATAVRPWRDHRVVRQLRAVTGGSDVVHAHGLRAAALTGLALGRRRPGRIPLVATWHNAVLVTGPRRAVLTGLEMLAARRADLTLCVSPDLVDRATDLGAPEAVLAPVPASAMPAPRRTRSAVRAELGASGRPVVLAVGRLAAQKDYDTLLAASAHLASHPLQPLILVAGDGPERDRLQRVIDTRRLPVRLLGRRDDVPDLLAAADVYVLSSRWEGSPLVVQEAMASGLPVVATAVGGIPHMVKNGALLVPAGDSTAIAREITTLLDDPGRRAELAARARAVAASWPDEDETARQVAAAYRELTGSN